LDPFGPADTPVGEGKTELYELTKAKIENKVGLEIGDGTHEENSAGPVSTITIHAKDWGLAQVIEGQNRYETL
jgi:hypothetical protein